MNPFKSRPITSSSKLYKAVATAFPKREVIPDYINEHYFEYTNYSGDLRKVDTTDGSIWGLSDRATGFPVRWVKLRTSRWFIVSN